MSPAQMSLPTPTNAPTSCTDACPEPQEKSGTASAAQPPVFEMIATAYNPHGQKPHCVVEFEHGSGHRVHRLLPVHALTSDKRARDALIKAGIPPSVASAPATLAAMANEPSSPTGLYDAPRGWINGCDVGTSYRYGNTAYSSSGPITIYADGPAPEPQTNGDIRCLTKKLASNHASVTVILMAAHLASLLVHLLDHVPLVIVVSGLSAAEAERVATLANFAFGTKPTAIHARRKDADDVLVRLLNVKLRKQAFAHAQIVVEACKGKARDSRTTRTHAPVTLILVNETEAPGNLASPTPPPGCIEIHADAPDTEAPTVTEQVSSDENTRGEAVATTAYIEAVLRKQNAIVSNADGKLPQFFERYLGMMKGLQNEGAVLAAAHTFALLRYALTCGLKLQITPWSNIVADNAVDACVQQWAASRRQREKAFEQHVVDAVKKLLNAGSPNLRAKFNEREVRLKSINGHELMLIDSATFDASIVGTLDKARVLGALRKRRLLVTNGKGEQYQTRVDGERLRFYAIDVAALRVLQATNTSNHTPARASNS